MAQYLDENSPNASSGGSGTANQGTPGPTTSPWPVEITNTNGNIATVTAAGALTVDNSAVTQPISAASLPLPAGASTSAKQAAPGTAGTPSADVVSIQGEAGMVAVKVDGSGVTQPISGSVAVTNFPATQPVSGTVAATQSGTWTVQPGNTANTTAWKVDGSGVTQPISGTITANAGTGTFTVGQATGTNLHTVVDSGSVTVSNFPATQPVSGTVTSNQGTANTVGNAWPTQITDGTNSADVTEASTAAVATDSALVVALSPNSPLPSGTNVIGHAIVDSGTVIATQATGTNLHTVVDNFPAVAQGSTTSGQLGDLMQAAVSTNAPAYTDATTSPLSLSPTGGLRVAVSSGSSFALTQSSNVTYSAAVLGLASAAAATDIFTISGRAGKVVYISKLSISATQTAASEIDVLLIKRSTADSGGTATTPFQVPNDSATAAGTSVVSAYTANPTLGTAVGTIRTNKLFASAVAAASAASILLFDSSTGWQRPIVLRGTAEQLCVNLNGATITGGSFDIWVEWVEG